MANTSSNNDLGFRSLSLKKGITVSFFTYLVNLLFYSIYSIRLFYPIIISIAIYVVFHGVLLYMLKKGKYMLVRNLFIILSIVFLVFLTYFISGPETGVHYFLLIFSLLALSLANPERLWISVLYFSITLFLFAGAEFHFLPDFSVIDYPEKLAYIIRIQCIIISFVLIYFISYLFYRIDTKRERHITTQNEELQKVNTRLEKSQEHISMQNAKMNELNDELQVNIEVISRQNTELESANATKDKFFSLIAHDLKNPLAAVIGLSELLQNNIDGMSEDDVKIMLGGINESTNRINVLLMNLLNWARSQSGNITPTKTVFSLFEILEGNKKLFKQNLKEKNIDLQLICDEERKIGADSDMIDTVVRNLLSNAIKFTKVNGKIIISSNIDETEFVLNIKDSGVGMSQETIDKLQNTEYISSSYGTNNERGMGLGLKICKEFLELNNCSLRIESQLGEGSTFSIVFPAGTYS